MESDCVLEIKGRQVSVAQQLAVKEERERGKKVVRVERRKVRG